jgi:hypothetical protein
MQQSSETFPTMLKLISGALIGGVNYKKIYMDSDNDDKINPPITTIIMGENQNTNILKIPILPEISRKVARLEKENLTKNNILHMK